MPYDDVFTFMYIIYVHYVHVSIITYVHITQYGSTVYIGMAMGCSAL